MTNFLFVYGTLMSGHHDDWQEKVGAHFVGRGRITGKLYRLGQFPGAVRSDAGSHVQGEVYRLSNVAAALEILDKYEEFEPTRPGRSLFIRRQVSVEMADGSSSKAWAYFYNRSVKNSDLIHSGNFNRKLSVRR